MLMLYFKTKNTHTPFGGVPGCEPPSEGGWLKSLLYQDDGGVRVSGARVGAQVLLARDHCFFALHLIGFFTDPEKHLESTMRKGRMGFERLKGIVHLKKKIQSLSTLLHADRK